MFRLTIRELLLITTCAALSIVCWQSRAAHQAAAEDARMLAHFSACRTGFCGNEASRFADLQRKYGAEPVMITPRFVIVEEEEEKLGIDFEDN